MDPYLVAHLRGGRDEAIRVALVSLLDRGLLKEDDSLLGAASNSIEVARRPLDRAILGRFARLDVRSRAFDEHGDPVKEADTLAAELVEKRLLPGVLHFVNRLILGAAAGSVLVWLATTKIDVARARGHENVFFLWSLMFGALFVLVRVVTRRRTALGDRVVSDLEELFSGLRARASRIERGGATNELALLVGVYGVEALPENVTFDRLALLPPQKRKQGSSCSSGGSSCGSSGGSSCGSSCGGGGCGGGCGGCGS
jgi:uncharacterized protein (TIGR04222 family)